MLTKRSTLVVWVIAALLAFFPPWWLLRPRAAFEILNSLLVACAFGVWVAYVKGLVDALREMPHKRTAGDYLVIGIMLESTGLIMIFANLWWFRVSGGDVAILNNWSAGFGRWTVFIGAMFHLAAARAVEGRVPDTAFLKAGIWAAFGVLGALVLLGLGIE